MGRTGWNGSVRRHIVLRLLTTGRTPAVTLAGKEVGTTAGTTTTSRVDSVRETADPAKMNMETAAAEAVVADSQA